MSFIGRTAPHDMLSTEHRDTDVADVPADGDVLTYDSAIEQWKAEAPAGGPGGGGEPDQRLNPSNGPGGANDDEFDNESIAGAWTLVRDENRGTWTEKYDRLSYNKTTTGSGTRDLEAQVRSLTLSVGDYVETAISFSMRALWHGCALIMTDGTTFGSGNQVVANCWHTAASSGIYRMRMDGFTSYNSVAGSGTEFNFMPPGEAMYIRLKYESANTWGMYASPNGITWYTIQNNFSKTLTPTHAGVAIVHWDDAAAPQWGDFHYFRVNPA